MSQKLVGAVPFFSVGELGPHRTQSRLDLGQKTGSLYAMAPLSCVLGLSVTLVYCGQTVGWIKMKLLMEVGLGPGQIVLDGDLAPKKWGHRPNFRTMSVVAKRLDGGRPRSRQHYVRWGPSSQKMGTQTQFSDYVCRGQTAGWR